MYSRYMRSGGLWEDSEHQKTNTGAGHATPVFPSFAAGLSGASTAVKHEQPAPPRETGGGLSSLFKNMKLDFDLGDLLLIAIIVFLLVEGDDIEMVIALALVLFGWL